MPGLISGHTGVLFHSPQGRRTSLTPEPNRSKKNVGRESSEPLNPRAIRAGTSAVTLGVDTSCLPPPSRYRCRYRSNVYCCPNPLPTLLQAVRGLASHTPTLAVSHKSESEKGLASTRKRYSVAMP